MVGVDVSRHVIKTARKLARREGLADSTQFEEADAARQLPLADGSFDAVVCIDAINHLPDRPAVLADWHRLLRPGGSVLFTDPIVVTGLLTSEEIAVRASIGFFVFSLLGANERLVHHAGFELVRCDDTTESVVEVTRRWRDARARHRALYSRTRARRRSRDCSDSSRSPTPSPASNGFPATRCSPRRSSARIRKEGNRK